MPNTSLPISYRNLGVGRNPTTQEKEKIIDYLLKKIVMPRRGTKRNAEYLIDMSDVLVFNNLTPEQPEIVKITWYEKYAPWRFYGLAEYFVFSESSLQLVSSPICPDVFWLPSGDGKDASRASNAICSAISSNPILADLFEFRDRELSNYGVILPSEEKKWLKGVKKKYPVTHQHTV